MISTIHIMLCFSLCRKNVFRIDLYYKLQFKSQKTVLEEMISSLTHCLQEAPKTL